MHSTTNLSPLQILKKTQLFLETQLSYLFENFFYFSRIQRLLCFNLVMKKSNQKLRILPERLTSKLSF